MNDDGEFEERELEKSELPPPPPPPVKKPRKSSGPRIGAAKAPKAAGDTTARSSRVKVTKRATKQFAAGKTALDHDMVRFECDRCGASRVGNEESKGFLCSLCAVPMKRVTR
jgi:hypothetical protein